MSLWSTLRQLKTQNSASSNSEVNCTRQWTNKNSCFVLCSALTKLIALMSFYNKINTFQFKTNFFFGFGAENVWEPLP